MTIFDIDEEIRNIIDEETGEIADIDEYNKLNMSRNEKLENIGKWIIELNAEAKAIKEQEQILAERRKHDEHKVESLKHLLDYVLCGEKFKTPSVSISYRKSSAVELSDDFLMTADKKWLTFEPRANKTAIKEAITNGEEIAGATIVEHNSVIVK